MIHAFIERLVHEFATRINGENPERLAQEVLSELPSWRNAIHATLASAGLPPAEVERAQLTVQRALRIMLQSSNGRWLLLPHRNAAAESSWRSGTGERTSQIRLDRSFLAGSKPYESGEHTLWIVDFKTGDHEGNHESYLQQERLRYEPQLRTYAEVLLRAQPADTPVVLALYYPLMDRLMHWPYTQTAAMPPVTTSRPASNGKAQLTFFG